MRIHRRLVAAGLTAALLNGCSDAISPSPRILDGTWAEEGEVPGSSNRWTLAVSGTDVTGTGTWSGEACCGGTLAITGYVQGDSIYLAIKTTGSPFVSPDSTTAVVGVLRSSSEMAVSQPTRPGSLEFRMRKCTGHACDSPVVH